MSFGQHLRRLGEDSALSRAELARRAAVPLGSPRRREGNRGFPGLHAALRLAGALGVPVERFAERVEGPEEEEPAAPPEKPRRRRKGKTS